MLELRARRTEIVPAEPSNDELPFATPPVTQGNAIIIAALGATPREVQRARDLLAVFERAGRAVEYLRGNIVF